MTVHRLDRRLAILRGKRQSAFNRDQYFYESAPRERVARKVRLLLRRMQPVVVLTPRWSRPQRFLDDVSTDLLLGEPSVKCKSLSLAPLAGRTPHQAWAWLAQAVTEFCRLTLDGPAWQVVSRRGFRHVMKDLFERAEHGERRCLMIHGLEHIHVEALRDLIEVFEDHMHQRTGEPRFNLLLAGSIDAPHFEFAGLARITLPDFSAAEAVDALVELVEPGELARLESLVDVVGGVPEIIEVLATEAVDRMSDVVGSRDAVWRVLGHLALEIRSSFDIIAADEKLSTRLEQIARSRGPLPVNEDHDHQLLRAGLVRQVGPSNRPSTELRAPVFADLALSR